MDNVNDFLTACYLFYMQYRSSAANMDKILLNHENFSNRLRIFRFCFVRQFDIQFSSNNKILNK